LLILFDIDMTLITTSGTGMKAMADAGRELLGSQFSSTDGIQFAGRLDPLIITDIYTRHGVEDAPERHREFRAVYGRHLKRRLAEPGVGRALPGVQDLLALLVERRDILLGLLTGNFEETGSMKLRACGIDPSIFSIRVWGDESPHHPPKREHLVPVGIERARALPQREALHAREVTVIGDTPHDIQCARAHGCRSLGVATGHFSATDLSAAGADLALADLADTRRVVDWLLARPEVGVGS
jgi:phosphoglycolate phosphatase-like HAD superfamily hydrolase